MEPFYFDKKAIQTMDKWIKESEEPYQDAYISLNWYEPIGSGPGGISKGAELASQIINNEDYPPMGH